MSYHSSEAFVSKKTNDSEDFVRNFLFGRSSIDQDGACIRAPLSMDLHTEGWIGIPHGGIGMGAIMDIAAMLENYPKSKDLLYPLSVDFRFGGARVRTGDEGDVKVSPSDGGAHGIISASQNPLPYISATVKYLTDESQGKNIVTSYMPERITDDEHNRIPLPHYRNCFVCGVERSHPGLQRCFHFLHTPESGKMVISTAGFESGDKKSFYLFQRNNTIHPLPFLALLDETMGWAGFMACASGAVTVRIGYTFFRDIHVDEKILVFGRGEKVKGNIGSRLFYWASGGVAAVHDEGKLEMVIASSGQYLGVAELTEQMKRELIPKEYTARAFNLAGS